MNNEIIEKERVPVSARKWKNLDCMRHETAEYIIRKWLSQDDQDKGLKHAFPELENLDGRFLIENVMRWYGKLREFVYEIAVEVEDFVESSKEKLGDKICYNHYIDDPLCIYCTNFEIDFHLNSCNLYPHMGKIYEGAFEEDFYTELKDEWYLTYPWCWCIRVCPGFKFDKNKIAERKELIKELKKDSSIEF